MCTGTVPSFWMLWRNGTELDVVRAIKTKTALDICVVAKKCFGEPERKLSGMERQ
jgi:hypothetical protein